MSILSVEIGGRNFRIDSEQGFDLSIPLRFDGEGLSAFGAPKPVAGSFETQGFIGDTRRGGSCNVQRYSLIPHCHGTHTECVGHLLDEARSVCDLVRDFWIPATLLSIAGEPSALCTESYSPEPDARDTLISKAAFDDAIGKFSSAGFQEALIIRTLPNEPSKVTRAYSHAPYFSNDAMRAIASLPVRHLLVDLPSLDRMDDQGQLSNHRIYWGLPATGHSLPSAAPSTKTVTELIYVKNQILDGYYLLNLQVAPFCAEAAPSRPVIFRVQPA